MFALLPACLWLLGNQRSVFGGVLAALGLTVVLGRDFAYVNAHVPLLGHMYVLDLFLVAALLLGSPTIVRAVRQNHRLSLIVGIILLATLAELARGSISREALRDSVIGLYSLWALVGAALVVSGRVQALAKTLYAMAIPSTVVFAVFLASASNPLTDHVTPKLVPASYSLYLGFSILLVLFVPAFFKTDRARFWASLLAIVQGVVVAAGQVRSIWVAFAVVVVGMMFAGGLPSFATVGLLRYGFALFAIAVAAAVVIPRPATKVVNEAQTLIAYNPNTGTAAQKISESSTQWRFRRWSQALDDLARHPLDGKGFGKPLIEDRATEVAYLSVGVPPPRIDPHNSFIAFAVRFGIFGFLVLVAFEVAVIRSAVRLFRRSLPPLERQFAHWLVACHLLVAGHSLFTVVLEGPYMGLFFWLFGGLVIAFGRASGVVRPREAVT
jgi:O-antigen ligase